jgi:hypothetical protein
MDPLRNVTTTIIPLTVANTEYSFFLPDETKQISFGLRTAGAYLYYSWQSGQVPSNSGAYITLLPGSSIEISEMNLLGGKTIYFSTDTNSQIVEMEIWN